MFDIKEFSKDYKVIRLTHEHIEDIYQLCCQNQLYYQYYPPFVTLESIKEDMLVFPKGTTLEDKYYVGFYEQNKLIVVMDLIDGYPQKQIAFLGFFMSDVTIQNKGIGTQIIKDVCEYLQNKGYISINLAWVKGNPQAKHFWLKNKFIPIKETTSNDGHQVILAKRYLKE